MLHPFGVAVCPYIPYCGAGEHQITYDLGNKPGFTPPRPLQQLNFLYFMNLSFLDRPALCAPRCPRLNTAWEILSKGYPERPGSSRHQRTFARTSKGHDAGSWAPKGRRLMQNNSQRWWCIRRLTIRVSTTQLTVLKTHRGNKSKKNLKLVLETTQWENVSKKATRAKRG